MSVEESIFHVKKDDGAFQLRVYEAKKSVAIVVDESFQKAMSFAFYRLFDFISGRNSKKIKIAMTTPVEMQRYKSALWKVSFNLPASFTTTQDLEPEDPELSMDLIPKKEMAVVRFSGFCTEKKVEKMTKSLKEYIAKHSWLEKGEPIIARYDPPWILPWFRRNEILIEVQA
jgi:hypothetical protein